MCKIRQDGVITSAKGIPTGARWLVDGRLSFGWDNKGASRVEYIAPRRPDGCHVVFRRGVFNSFRMFLEKDGKNYHPEYKNVEVTPYSLTADWMAEGENFRVGVYALDESMVFAAEAPKALKSDNWKFKVQFYYSTQFVPADNGDPDSRDFDAVRVWRGWNIADGILSGGYNETGKDGSHHLNLDIAIGGDTAPEYWMPKAHHSCIAFKSGIRAGETRVFGVAFGVGADIAKKRLDGVTKNFAAALEKQRARYENVNRNAPKLESGNAALDGLFAVIPLYHESLKVDGIEGAFKVRNSRYWIWGWDSLLSSAVPSVWGDSALVGGMTDFFRATAHPEDGIFHAAFYDNSGGSKAPLSSQGIYISALYNYYQATEDIAKLKEHYGFAKTIFERMAALEKDNSGFCEGTSLFPDFPDCFKENGNDLSIYNNTLLYGAARAMESLALLAGDGDTAAAAKGLFCRMESNIGKYFFDEDLGYFVNSVDSVTLAKRKAINICGVVWDEDGLYDLLASFAAPCADFIVKHGIGKGYFRTIPLWDDAYDADANQLHCTWPAVVECITQFGRIAGRKEITDAWTKFTGDWAARLTIPEGISYFLEEEQPEYDEWNCEVGVFQANASRKWYQEILKIRLGIKWDIGGLTFDAPLCKGYTIDNLNICGGRKTAVKTKGAGGYIACLEAGGRKYYGTQKLPFDAGDSVTVVLGKEQSLVINSLTGGRLTGYNYGDGRITATLSGAGVCRLYVKGARKVSLDGTEVRAVNGRYELNLRPGIKHGLEIK